MIISKNIGEKADMLRFEGSLDLEKRCQRSNACTLMGDIYVQWNIYYPTPLGE